MKVMTIVGTRPEIIKLSRVIPKLDQHFEHTLVHTGQNFDYELNEIFFKDLGLRQPDEYLNAAKETAIESIAEILKKSDQVMEKIKPDALLLYGDTNSCLSVIAAKKRKIPVFHMEAGNRCFDQRVPEEINRKIVDHLSDINLPLTEHARRYLLAEGLKAETVIKTGSCLPEVLEFYKSKIEKSDVLQRLGKKKGQYFIASIHREENVDNEQNFSELLFSLNRIADEFQFPILVSTHPRTRKRLEQQSSVQMSKLIEFLPPFSFTDYVHLQQNAHCVISDSGTITEEASILKFPAIMIRQAHERPEGMDAGVLIMSGLNNSHIIKSIKSAVQLLPKTPVQDYENLHVSEQVVKVIFSYTPYVNSTVWKSSK